MTNYKQWTQTIAELKLRYPELHFLYSSKDGWLVLSFKGKSVTVLYTDSDSIIQSKINRLL